MRTSDPGSAQARSRATPHPVRFQTSVPPDQPAGSEESRARMARLFPGGPPIVGMIHLAPLPGSPRFSGSLDAVLERAVAEAALLQDLGVDGLLVENFGDVPFHKETVPPVTVATMTRAVVEIRRALGRREIPVGVNVLRNDARSAIAIAAASGASFIRVNVHIGASVTDQGVIEGRSDETLRLRASIAPECAILADLRVKHARPLVERPLEEEVSDLLERGLADVLLITGARTGSAPDPAELERARTAARGAPVWIASGLDGDNASRMRGLADGFIVGSALKRDGRATEPIDPSRARAVIDALRAPEGGASRG